MKRRVPWKRGPKMRYSVYKAENCIDRENDFKEWAENFAEVKNLDIDDFSGHGCKPFWQETYERMCEHWKSEREGSLPGHPRTV